MTRPHPGKPPTDPDAPENKLRRLLDKNKDGSLRPEDYQGFLREAETLTRDQLADMFEINDLRTWKSESRKQLLERLRDMMTIGGRIRLQTAH